MSHARETVAAEEKLAGGSVSKCLSCRPSQRWDLLGGQPPDASANDRVAHRSFLKFKHVLHSFVYWAGHICYMSCEEARGQLEGVW